ncbi:ATP-binding response regulator [Halorientalis salina]|uniref:ATP-binding response regulator n=1 Tax=Halorientalis salina TaxID=2932266 RepID=UPI0010AD44F8|nr:ATP-binding protein [Halorientalis salina]
MSDVDVDPIRVLHVDDDPEIVDLAATFLKREDDRLDVELAETAGEALEAVREGTVHCVISDYQLPDMGCDEFVAAVHEEAPGIPFLLFTGRDRAQIDETVLDSAVTAYLQKGSGTEQYGELADEILTAVAEYDPVRTDGGRSDPSASVADDGFEDESAAVERVLQGLGVEDGGTVLVEALDAIRDGFFILDRDGELVYWNRYIPTVTGYDADEISEMEPADFFVPDHRDRIDDAIAETVETGSAVVEARVHQRGGTEIPTEFRGSRLTDETGAVVGIAGIARDVSDRVAHERELERQNERLEELVGAVSHDLRNPLNVITGRLQLARETGDEDHFEALDRATQRMEGLIEDLVELARQGHTVSDGEPVALDDLAVTTWSGLETAEATLTIETDRSVVADEHRLRQILANLFQNSVKHAGEDVSVTLGAMDDGFYVADDGTGIPEDERDRLLEYGETMSQGGTGFGLAIVRRTVEAHGWTVSLTDSERGGLRVEITGVSDD